MTTAIAIDNVTVHRGGRPVLRDLTCRIAAGSITGLLGPSGAGKTTLLRAIVGVQRIRSGSVTVLGMAAGSPSLRARTGYVTQSASIYDDLTVTQNIAYFASIAGAPRGSVDDVIAATGLKSVARHRAGALSGGQRSRTSLACALVGDPALLVLDEPTVGQDPLLREDLWSMFRNSASSGTTVVVSSHVMDEASRCEKILMIREGTVLADDTPAAILRSTGADDMDGAFLALVTGRPPADAGISPDADPDTAADTGRDAERPR